MADIKNEYQSIINWDFLPETPEDEILTEEEQLKSSKKELRSLRIIARDIYKDWKNVNYAAQPYLQAMSSLEDINDKYGFDDGKSIVAYFLSNASSWKGDVAKMIKAELKGMLKSKRK